MSRTPLPRTALGVVVSLIGIAVAVALMTSTKSDITAVAAFVAVACLVGGLFLTGVLELPRHRWLARRREELAELGQEASFAQGLLSEVRGTLGPWAVTLRQDQVAFDVPGAPDLALGRRELRDITYGARTSRTDLAPLAARADVREAAQLLLDRAGPRLKLEIVQGRAQLRGLGKAPLVALVGAVTTLAAPARVRMQQTERGDCPYCKQVVRAIDADGVFRCPTCEAAHHAGCWQEHGGCSVFGCERAPAQDRERPPVSRREGDRSP